jgi:hypothetical protein
MTTGIIIAAIAGGLTLLWGVATVRSIGNKVVALMAEVVEAAKDGKFTAAEIEAIIDAAKAIGKKEQTDEPKDPS